ncbi:hypothetical protein F6X68_32465 [Micromonospora sp. AMSO12t]|uniref:hypothetical protein n=1 Tax=Micromonospora sp. AMSO12t TaxID=2650410 RepID=UPI00124B9C29|nr:hypothetical protein [Micromonospora sp. AMSO12t]KAB1125301.1 hypothetical protein F6X68_32465 [Micromonospora sp. AMSO12t]
MPVLTSKLDTVVSASYMMFCLYSHGANAQRDHSEAGRLAFADGVGFAASAVGVRTATEVSRAFVSVETWSRMPWILPEQRPFDFAFEGVVDFPDNCWRIDESLDSPVRCGIVLPSGAGRYGARVIAYNHNEVLDRFEMAQAGTEEFTAALDKMRRLIPEAAERYQIQLWPLGRQG